jgi:valyl-tRNA synthetase
MLNTEAPAGAHHDVVSGFTISIEFPPKEITKEQLEKTQREIEKARKELGVLEAQLGNEQFVKNAPPAVVQQAQARRAELTARIEKLQQNAG